MGIRRYLNMGLFSLAVMAMGICGASAQELSGDITQKTVLTEDTKLVGNVTTSGGVVVKSGSNITIDLNGYNLTANGVDAITVELGATATIKGNGTVEAVGKGVASLYNNGTTIINGGTFLKDESKGTYYSILNHGDLTISDGTIKLVNFVTSSLIDNGYYNYDKNTDEKMGYVAGTNMASPKLTINGGEFSGGQNTVKNDDGGILVINGGHFTNDQQYVIMNWNEATINNGTFEVTHEDNKMNTAVFNGTYGKDSKDKGILNVNGGTFTADYFLVGTTNDSVDIKGAILNVTNDIIHSAVKGGSGITIDSSNVTLKDVTSTLEPNTDLIADEYEVQKIDGKYVVTKKVNEVVPNTQTKDTSNSISTSNNDSNSKAINNPATSDNITIYLLLSILSFSGIYYSSKMLKQQCN